MYMEILKLLKAASLKEHSDKKQLALCSPNVSVLVENYCDAKQAIGNNGFQSRMVLLSSCAWKTLKTLNLCVFCLATI